MRKSKQMTDIDFRARLKLTDAYHLTDYII